MDERLRYFRMVVEVRSFTEAARRLRIAQPSLSAAVAKLEKELKTSLLQRGGGIFQITPAGRMVYAFACEQAVRRRGLTEHLAILNKERTELRLGMIDSIADAFCDSTDLLTTLEHRHRVSLRVDASASLVEAVRRQEIDFALVVHDASDTVRPPLRQTPLGDEPLLNVFGDPGRQARRLIAYNRSSLTFQVVRQAFAAVGRNFEPAIHSSSPETMLRLVRSDWGHAVLPLPLIRGGLRTGRLYPLLIGAGGFARRPISVVRQRDHPSLEIVTDSVSRVLARQVRQAERLVAPLYEDL